MGILKDLLVDTINLGDLSLVPVYENTKTMNNSALPYLTTLMLALLPNYLNLQDILSSSELHAMQQCQMYHSSCSISISLSFFQPFKKPLRYALGLSIILFGL